MVREADSLSVWGKFVLRDFERIIRAIALGSIPNRFFTHFLVVLAILQGASMISRGIRYFHGKVRWYTTVQMTLRVISIEFS